MASSKSKSASTILFGFILSLIVSFNYFIVNILSYPFLNTLIKLCFLVLFLSFAVYINRDKPRPYLIPIKIIALTFIFLILVTIPILVLTSLDEPNINSIVNKVATELPSFIVAIVTFLLSIVIPLTMATALGVILNMTRNSSEIETLDDNMVQK